MVKFCVEVVELRCRLVPGRLQGYEVKSFTNLPQTDLLTEWFIVLHFAAKKQLGQKVIFSTEGK